MSKQHFFMRYSVAYAENFHGVFGSGSYGGQLHLVCAVCDVTISLISMFPNQCFGEVC